MSRFMHILVFSAVLSGRLAVNIDLQSLGLKSDRKEGGFLGLKIYNLNLYIFTTETICKHNDHINS